MFIIMLLMQYVQSYKKTSREGPKLDFEGNPNSHTSAQNAVSTNFASFSAIARPTFFIGDKINTFCSSTAGVGKIAKV